MNLEERVSEISQAQKGKQHIIPFVSRVVKYIERWSPGAGGGGKRDVVFSGWQLGKVTGCRDGRTVMVVQQWEWT
jgi:hypothetical protein